MAPNTRSKEMKRIKNSRSRNLHYCYRCLKSFATESEIDNHNRLHHREDTKKCKLCGTVYPRKRDLKHHKKSEHEKKNISTSTGSDGEGTAPSASGSTSTAVPKKD